MRETNYFTRMGAANSAKTGKWAIWGTVSIWSIVILWAILRN